MINIILKYWMEILLTTITSGFIYVFKQYIGLKEGLKALLRNEIVRIYEIYSRLGYCPSYMKKYYLKRQVIVCYTVYGII